MFFFKLLLTLSWRRLLPYRNQFIDLLRTGFYMITTSIMKELKWGKNEEKCWVQHILWSSKLLFCFWIDAYIFFQMVISQRCFDEKHNVVSTLFYVVNFNVDKHNVVSTLIWRCATSRRHINLKTALNRRWNVCWGTSYLFVSN